MSIFENAMILQICLWKYTNLNVFIVSSKDTPGTQETTYQIIKKKQFSKIPKSIFKNSVSVAKTYLTIVIPNNCAYILDTMLLCIHTFSAVYNSIKYYHYFCCHCYQNALCKLYNKDINKYPSGFFALDTMTCVRWVWSPVFMMFKSGIWLT